MLSDWSDHQVSLKLTLRYLKGARKQHSVVGGRWHHQSPPLLNTSARLLATLLNMFLCKHWYILLFLLPFVSRCLSAARPPPAAAAGDLLSLSINLCIFAKVEGLFRFYARRTVESSARHPCGKENRSAFPSGGGPKTSRAVPRCSGFFFFLTPPGAKPTQTCWYFWNCCWPNHWALPPTAACVKLLPASAVQPLGLDVLLGSHHCQLFILFDVQHG